jgi:hypothetical protein
MKPVLAHGPIPGDNSPYYQVIYMRARNGLVGPKNIARPLLARAAKKDFKQVVKVGVNCLVSLSCAEQELPSTLPSRLPEPFTSVTLWLNACISAPQSGLIAARDRIDAA